MPTIFRLGTASLFLLVVGCGGDKGTVPTPANVVGATGGTATLDNGAVSMSFPPGAVAATTSITATHIADPSQSEHTIAGTTYEFGPTGTQFAQPVAVSLKYDPSKLPPGVPAEALRLAKSVNGRWQILTDGASVDSASGRVRANLRSFSPYGVVGDPCYPYLIGTTAADSISPKDCEQTANGLGYYADFYTPGVTTGMIRVTPTTPTGLNIKFFASVALLDPATGDVVAINAAGQPVNLLANGARLFLEVSNRGDRFANGGYRVDITPNLGVSHTCDTDTYLMPGSSFSQTLLTSNSCTYPVQVSPVPEAIGKPLLTHLYGLTVHEKQTATVALTGLGSSLPLGLTIFANGQVVAQSVPGPGSSVAAGGRSLTLRPAVTTTYIIEVSSGVLVNSAWVNPTGTYSLSVSK